MSGEEIAASKSDNEKSENGSTARSDFSHSGNEKRLLHIHLTLLIDVLIKPIIKM